jgi:hypothetical protein
MLNKLKYSFYRFMNGRYGSDQLNFAIIITSIFISLVGGIVFNRSVIITLIVYTLSFIVLFRAFSKKIYVRQKENLKFMSLIRPIKSKYNLIKLNLTQKQYKHVQCPRCHRTLRVPRGRGKIEISCPHCHVSFDKRS